MRASRNIITSVITLLLIGCSGGPIEVENSSWVCEKKNKTRECIINYTIINNDDFVQEATVKIRAHKRRRINDAVSNEVVGEETIIVRLSPNEKTSLSHKMNINRKITQIVVSAYVANENL